MIRYWRVALLAFAGMMAQDLAYTLMTVYESRLNAPFSAVFDELGWVAQLVCSALAIGEITKNGWKSRKSLSIIGAICFANLVGTVLGIQIAKTLT